MKKTFLFLPLLAIACFASAQQQRIHVSELAQNPHLMTVEQRQAFSNAGIDKDGYLPPVLNELSGYNLTDSIYNYDGDLDSWVLNQKIYFDNDCSVGKASYRESHLLDNGLNEFVPFDRTLWTFLPDGNERTIKTYTWDDDDAFWVGTEYDSLIGVMKSLEYWRLSWDGVNNNFTGGNRTVTTRNANGDELVSVQQYAEFGSQQWVNSNRFTYTYNAAGLREMEQSEYADATTGQWVASNRKHYTYNAAGSIVEELSEQYLAGIYTPQYRASYGYDANGNLSVYN